MSFASFLLVLLLASSVYPLNDYPFRDITLPWSDRVNDLVGRLTLEEVMLQLAKGGAGKWGGPAPPIKRLGIGPYSWNTECLRGDVRAGNATSYPQAIGLAAAFSTDLIYRVGEATAIEVHAKFNDYVKKGQYGDHKGLSCFSPVINILRDPRWGRNQETYGEDPYFAGEYAAGFVSGLQGNHSRYIRANAGCKHIAAYDGPENIPVTRMTFNAKVTERDLRTTFLPAFRRCVRAGTYSIGCTYTSLNGIPTCAHKRLLTDILRNEWHFTGYIFSDEGAVENLKAHHYANTSVDMAAACLNAGCNLELSGGVRFPAYLTIVEGVRQKKLNESFVRESVKPLFYTRMRLGEFDPPEMNPYTKLNLSEIESPAHQKLAVEAAEKTFVLLKNQGNFLPLQKAYSTVTIVGPMANNSLQLFGDYAPSTLPQYITTPLVGLSRLANNIKFASGCGQTKCQWYDASAVKKAVEDTELIIVCLGTGQSVEMESNDRSDVSLPGHQLQLLQDVVANRNDTPVILLLFNACPLNVTWADQNEGVSAIMECFFPAQGTGTALYNIITHQNQASPAARLPNTWPLYASDIGSMTDYNMIGKTYRYFKGKTLYPFGYGLSYSKFWYKDLTMQYSIEAGQDIHGSVTVNNVGIFDTDEVVQFYMSWMDPTVPTPLIQLVTFSRVFLQKGNGTTMKLTITAEQMAVWMDNKGWVVQEGLMMVYAGGQQPYQDKSVGSNVLSFMFKIVGSKVLGYY